MKTSINAWSCPQTHDFETVFKSLKAAGFDGVELNVDSENAPSAHSLTVCTTQDELNYIRNLSETYGVAVCGISSSQYGADTLASGTREGRDRARRVMEAQLRFAQALGADGILVVPGGATDDRSIKSAWDNNQEALLSMKDMIEGASAKVGLENVWNNFFISPMDMCRFLDEINLKNLGAYFDVGNVAIFTNPEYWIELLAHRIVKIHVKDFLKASKNEGCFVNLLEGSIRWNRVVRALRTAGYDGYLTAELSSMPQTPDYLYRITKDALDTIIAME